MTPVELLQELTDADVALWVDGDRLRYLAGRSLAPTLRVAVAAGRAELVALLRRGVALPADVGAWPEGHIEALDERAAVMEFDGLLGRAEAERAAEHRVRLRAARTFLKTFNEIPAPAADEAVAPFPGRRAALADT